MNDFVRNLQTVLAKLQNTADELWQIVDEYSLSLTLRIEQSGDPIEALKQARNVHASSLEICAALRSVVQPLGTRADAFNEKVEKFKLDIDKAARNCCLSRLPDEVLVIILDRAAGSLKSSVLLSHVCRRFQQTIRSSSVHWNGACLPSLGGLFENRPNLTSDMPPSIIRGILERLCNTSVLLKAEIQPASHTDSVKAIMDIGARLGELTITTSYEDEDEDGDGDGDRIDAPPPTFPGHCYTPFLQTLNCAFIPHPSLARNIVYCNLNARFSLDYLSLKELLEFLSNAQKLERLDLFSYTFRDLDTVESLGCVSLPSLTTLKFKIHDMDSHAGLYRCFMEKLVPFNVSTLLLDLHWGAGIRSLLGFIEAKPSMRHLHLQLGSSWRQQAIGEVFPFIPRHIETLEFVGMDVAKTIDWWLRRPEWFPARNLRLLKLGDCEVAAVNILHLRDRLVESGCAQVRFQFEDCEGMKDGTYDLADVYRAVPQLTWLLA